MLIYESTTFHPDMRRIRKVVKALSLITEHPSAGYLNTIFRSNEDEMSYRPIGYLRYMNGRCLRIDIAFKQIYKYIEYSHRCFRGIYFHQYPIGNTKRTTSIYADEVLSDYTNSLQTPWDTIYSNSYTLQTYVYDTIGGFGSIDRKYNCSGLAIVSHKLTPNGSYLISDYLMDIRYSRSKGSIEVSGKAPFPINRSSDSSMFVDSIIHTELMSKKQKRKSRQIDRFPKIHVKSKDCLYHT